MAAGLLCLLCLGACTRAGESDSAASSAAAAAASASHPELSGGDTRAWLTARGDLADSGYCAASLALPLARTPDWVLEYSRAEFSREMPNSLVHYDGLLAVTANSTLVLGIDVATGETRFNLPLYETVDIDAVSEEFKSLFFSPGGQLLGRDDLGRHYCWELNDDSPHRDWISETGASDGGYVVSASAVYTSFFEDVSRLDLATGETTWEVPILIPAGGIVMADDGTVIWWSRRACNVLVLDSADGRERWQYAGPNMVDRIIIDNQNKRFYMFLESEKVQCRDLATSDILWEFSWNDVMSPEEREQIISSSGWEGFYLIVGSVSALPDGLVFGLVSGEVFRLDLDGAEVWRYDSGATIRDMLAFENGVLVSEFYTSAQTAPWGPLLAVMSRDEPQWNEITALNQQSTEQAEQGEEPADGSLKVGFGRTSVLDLDTGELLDLFEPELFAYTEMVPAGNKVIYGEVLRNFVYLGRSDEIAPRRILAFPWIRQGDS